MEFKKITKEICESIMANKTAAESVLVPDVYKIRSRNAVKLDDRLLYALVNCESPVEQMLSIELSNRHIELIPVYNPNIRDIKLTRQFEIKCKNGNCYRIDFVICVETKRRGFKIIGIECDGYDYHKQSKEQINYDYARTRDIQHEGIELIKFTGSEIFNNVEGCVDDIVKLIIERCGDNNVG